MNALLCTVWTAHSQLRLVQTESASSIRSHWEGAGTAVGRAGRVKIRDPSPVISAGIAKVLRPDNFLGSLSLSRISGKPPPASRCCRERLSSSRQPALAFSPWSPRPVRLPAALRQTGCAANYHFNRHGNLILLNGQETSCFLLFPLVNLLLVSSFHSIFVKNSQVFYNLCSPSWK